MHMPVTVEMDVMLLIELRTALRNIHLVEMADKVGLLFSAQMKDLPALSLKQACMHPMVLKVRERTKTELKEMITSYKSPVAPP